MGAKLSAHCGADGREARNLNAHAYKAATDAIAAAVLADDGGGDGDMSQPLSSYFVSAPPPTPKPCPYSYTDAPSGLDTFPGP